MENEGKLQKIFLLCNSSQILKSMVRYAPVSVLALFFHTVVTCECNFFLNDYHQQWLKLNLFWKVKLKRFRRAEVIQTMTCLLHGTINVWQITIHQKKVKSWMWNGSATPTKAEKTLTYSYPSVGVQNVGRLVGYASDPGPVVNLNDCTVPPSQNFDTMPLSVINRLL